MTSLHTLSPGLTPAALLAGVFFSSWNEVKREVGGTEDLQTNGLKTNYANVIPSGSLMKYACAALVPNVYCRPRWVLIWTYLTVP